MLRDEIRGFEKKMYERMQSKYLILSAEFGGLDNWIRSIKNIEKEFMIVSAMPGQLDDKRMLSAEIEEKDYWDVYKKGSYEIDIRNNGDEIVNLLSSIMCLQITV